MNGPESSRRSFLQWMVGTTGVLVAGRSAEAAPRQGRRHISTPPRETSHSARRMSPEGKELPPGAFGFDYRGYPYGLHFRYQYVTERNEPAIDLSEPIQARNSAGAKRIKKKGKMVDYMVQLEREAADSWKQAETLFASARLNDTALGLVADALYLTDGYRSFAQQRQRWEEKVTVNEDGTRTTWAMSPGRSSHQIGRAFDIFRAKSPAMYKWLTGCDVKSKKFPPDGYIPQLVQLGIIPTEPAEPWHWEFIGSTPDKLAEAIRYWQQYGQDIMRKHCNVILKAKK